MSNFKFNNYGFINFIFVSRNFLLGNTMVSGKLPNACEKLKNNCNPLASCWLRHLAVDFSC